MDQVDNLLCRLGTVVGPDEKVSVRFILPVLMDSCSARTQCYQEISVKPCPWPESGLSSASDSVFVSQKTKRKKRCHVETFAIVVGDLRTLSLRVSLSSVLSLLPLSLSLPLSLPQCNRDRGRPVNILTVSTWLLMTVTVVCQQSSVNSQPALSCIRGSVL